MNNTKNLILLFLLCLFSNLFSRGLIDKFLGNNDVFKYLRIKSLEREYNKNNKKECLEIKYDRNGKIIKQNLYRNNKLVK